MKKLFSNLIRIIVALVVFAVGFAVPLKGYWRLFLYVPLYLLIGYDVLWRAIRNIARGKVFDENFLMAVATIGAFVLGDYKEAVAVMLFYQVGELFQSYAVKRSRKEIGGLMAIRPDFATLLDGEQVDPEVVRVGDRIVVKPGERVPLDGVVETGETMLDTSALTGESVPRAVKTGEPVMSGCINLSGLITVRVEKEYGESTVSKILELVENASAKKAKAENFITKFAKYYTPAVVIAAVVLAVVPPLFIAGHPFGQWIKQALIFLVISCPCALVISVPMGFFGGIGGASRRGILFKGSSYLEILADTDTVVFDKTGTLTEGVFEVTDVKPQGIDAQELLALAAAAERSSNHPIALSIVNAADRAPRYDADRVEEIAGKGIVARVDGKQVSVGNMRLMADLGFDQVQNIPSGTVVHVASEKSYLGYILISDRIRADAKRAVDDLHAVGVKNTVMLTGDSKAVAESVAAQVGVDNVYAELLPADKVDRLETILAQAKGKVAFVGDGINDAPVLMRADLGIAMGGIGSDAAIEAADMVLMRDEPSMISVGKKIAKKTVRIVRQNIVFALSIKAIVLILGAIGYANMWLAVFADVGVSVLAILNSMRALRTKSIK